MKAFVYLSMMEGQLILLRVSFFIGVRWNTNL